MPTLSEFAKLANDEVSRGVIEEIITENELMGLLQFKGFEGNSFLYNRENTLGASATHAVGDTWADTEPTYTQKTTSLAIVGVQHPLDLFIRDTRGNINSQEAILLQQMAKSLARKIEQLVITGDSGTVSTEFEGLTSLLIGEQRLLMMDDGTTPSTITGDETELTLDRLDAMIDLVENGPPDALIMNKTMRRKLTALSRASGSGVVMDSIELFGHQVRTYNGVPMVINDFITDAEIYENSGGWASSTATTIYAVQFGEEKGGLTVLHNGPVMSPSIQRIGIKENKNEELFRMVVYLQQIVFSTKHVAGLAGIDSTA